MNNTPPLKKRSTFFQGIASIFDIAPNDDYRKLADLDSTPEERIRKTWERVGAHLYTGIRQYEQAE